MGTSVSSFEPVLDCFPQPAFFVQGGSLTYCNHPAELLHLRTGDGLVPLLGRNAEFYQNTDGKRLSLLALQIDGQSVDFVLQRVEDTDVFTGAASSPDALPPDVVTALSQSLRKPITNLFSASFGMGMLLERFENPQLQEKSAGLNRGLYQLLRITGNLTELSRDAEKDPTFSPQTVDLHNFFSELTKRLRPSCEQLGVTLLLNCPGRQFFGSVDRQKLERAMLNLTSNALKFMPGGGTLSLTVRNMTDRVVICVSDTGEGMSPSVLSSAFVRFRGRDSLCDPRWGVGLGLPLTRRIARLHGGDLIIETRQGQGTTVTMTLSLESRENQNVLHSPILDFDYAGGYNHMLVELADVLNPGAFSALNLS